MKARTNRANTADKSCKYGEKDLEMSVPISTFGGHGESDRANY